MINNIWLIAMVVLHYNLKKVAWQSKESAVFWLRYFRIIYVLKFKNACNYGKPPIILWYQECFVQC